MKKLLFILLCSVSIIGHANVKTGTCKEAQTIENYYNSRILPKAIDSVTTMISYIVNCPEKRIIIEKQFFVDLKTISKATHVKLFKQFAVAQCTKGFAQYGWIVEDKYYDKNMKFKFRYLAQPKNCAKIKKPRNIL